MVRKVFSGMVQPKYKTSHYCAHQRKQITIFVYYKNVRNCAILCSGLVVVLKINEFGIRTNR